MHFGENACLLDTMVQNYISEHAQITRAHTFINRKKRQFDSERKDDSDSIRRTAP